MEVAAVPFGAERQQNGDGRITQNSKPPRPSGNQRDLAGRIRWSCRRGKKNSELIGEPGTRPRAASARVRSNARESRPTRLHPHLHQKCSQRQREGRRAKRPQGNHHQGNRERPRHCDAPAKALREMSEENASQYRADVVKHSDVREAAAEKW